MSAISLKSITGITSITTPAGVDNVFTVHSNDTTERFRVDSTGNLNIAGILTATTFDGGLPITNGANNRLITASSSSAIQGESGLTYDGSSLDIFDSSNSQSVIKLKRHASTASEQAHIGYFSSGLHIETREATYISLKTNIQERLRIASNGELTSTAAQADVATFTSNQTASTIYVKDTDGDGIFISGSSAYGHRIYTNTTEDLLLGTNSTERLRITSAGKVGIGTDSPDSNLTVHTTTPGQNVFNIHSDFTTNKNRTFNLYAPATDSGDDPFIFQTPNSIQFKVDSHEGLKIHSNGLVGINTNSPNAAWLDIATDVGTYDHIRLRRVSSDANIASNWSLKPYGRHLYFREGGSTDKIVFTDSGKVGINETDPSNQLHIAGTTSTSAGGLLRLDATTGDNFILYDNTHDSTEWAVGNDSATRGNFDFWYNDGSSYGLKLRITSGGNLGIARTNPQYRIHVHTVPTNSTQVTGLSIANDGSSSGVGAKINLGAVNGYDSTTAGISGWYDGTGTSLSLFTTATFASSGHVERLRITSGGQLNIGTDLTNSTYLFSSRGTGHNRVEIISTDNNSAGIYLRTFNSGSQVSNATVRTDNSGNLQFYTGTSSDGERLRIDSDGNVTIGKDGDSGSGPSAGYDELCIEGGNENIGMCFLSPAANNVEQTIAFGDSNNNQSGKIQYEHANDAMHFDTGGSERLRIDSSGHLHTGYTSGFGGDHVNIFASDGGGISISAIDISSAAASSGDLLGSYSFQGYLNFQTHINAEAKISAIAAANHTGTSAATDMVLYTKPSTTGPGSAPTERLRITGAGTITVPLGPTDFPSGTTASALVNTSGTQPNSNNDFQTNTTNNLASGWYTIAVSNGGRATGRIGIRDQAGSRHQAITFYAGHHYGGAREQNGINVIFSSGRHSGNPLGALRIKANNTYDGAMLQVYLRDSVNACQAFLLGDNFQSHGWIMKNWVADGTNPGDLVDWNSINGYGGIPAYADLNQILYGGASFEKVIPGFDNAFDLGSASLKWRDVYCNQGAFNNSDEALKQDIHELTTAEMNAAKRISKLFRTYKWKESVVEKGDDARIHTGAIAQQIQAAMSAEGLDAANYGFFGKDEWYEHADGTKLSLDAPTRENDTVGLSTNTTLGGNIVVPTGFNKITRYSVRYTELLAFVAAYNEQRFTSIETRLTTLESS